ncbi:MAG: DNA-binding transcriptional LysR family regulator [Planctomycetota bacterium]
MIARLVSEETAHLYATSAYLDRVGRPTSLAQMSRLDFIGFGEISQKIDYLGALGLQLTTENFKLASESGVVAWELVKAGLGIGAMSELMARNTPGLEIAFPKMAPITFPIWLTTHCELHTSRRIRLVFDLLAEFLATEFGSARR